MDTAIFLLILILTVILGFNHKYIYIKLHTIKGGKILVIARNLVEIIITFFLGLILSIVIVYIISLVDWSDESSLFWLYPIFLIFYGYLILRGRIKKTYLLTNSILVSSWFIFFSILKELYISPGQIPSNSETLIFYIIAFLVSNLSFSLSIGKLHSIYYAVGLIIVYHIYMLLNLYNLNLPSSYIELLSTLSGYFLLFVLFLFPIVIIIKKIYKNFGWKFNIFFIGIPIFICALILQPGAFLYTFLFLNAVCYIISHICIGLLWRYFKPGIVLYILLYYSALLFLLPQILGMIFIYSAKNMFM